APAGARPFAEPSGEGREALLLAEEARGADVEGKARARALGAGRLRVERREALEAEHGMTLESREEVLGGQIEQLDGRVEPALLERGLRVRDRARERLASRLRDGRFLVDHDERFGRE